MHVLNARGLSHTGDVPLLALRVPSALWQLQSTAGLLSCDTLCRHTSVTGKVCGDCRCLKRPRSPLVWHLSKKEHLGQVDLFGIARGKAKGGSSCGSEDSCWASLQLPRFPESLYTKATFLNLVPNSQFSAWNKHTDFFALWGLSVAPLNGSLKE